MKNKEKRIRTFVRDIEHGTMAAVAAAQKQDSCDSGAESKPGGATPLHFTGAAVKRDPMCKVRET